MVDAASLYHAIDMISVGYRLCQWFKDNYSAAFATDIAISTFILLKLFGEPLIADRLNLLNEMMARGIENGKITEEQVKQQIELANQIYSPSSQVLIVIMANLFVGFVSSILAAILIRK